jgi:hypothetical protein
MTKPLRHLRAEIESAARVAKDMGLTVRLENDGSITLIPDIHSSHRIDGIANDGGNSLREWRERHEGKARGRP